jgi:hypothetical protein
MIKTLVAQNNHNTEKKNVNLQIVLLSQLFIVPLIL